jgi:hypothetical protein
MTTNKHILHVLVFRCPFCVPDDDRQTELRLPARSVLDTAVHKTDFFGPNAQVQTRMTSFRDFQKESGEISSVTDI